MIFGSQEEIRSARWRSCSFSLGLSLLLFPSLSLALAYSLLLMIFFSYFFFSPCRCASFLSLCPSPLSMLFLISSVTIQTLSSWTPSGARLGADRRILTTQLIDITSKRSVARARFSTASNVNGRGIYLGAASHLLRPLLIYTTLTFGF